MSVGSSTTNSQETKAQSRPGPAIEESGSARQRGTLHLDRNENPRGPSPKVLEALQSRLSNTHLGRYPDPERFVEALAAHLSLGPEQVLASNGSIQAIERILGEILRPGAQVVIPSPSFPMFDVYARAAGGWM
jgi:histidinol-phosphate aminotransferase